MGIRLHKATGLPMHDDGQQWRVLGCQPASGLCALPLFSDKFATTDPSTWVEGANDFSSIPVFNQGQFGSCTGHGSVTAFTFSWLLSGQNIHTFSPTSVYARINGGQDKGAQVHDALLALQQDGTCFMSQFGENDIFLSQMSTDAAQTALRFRVGAAYKINSWAEMCSAISQGLVVVSGFAVGQNFSNVDANGVCPLPDQIAGGHCMAHFGLKQINGVWMVRSRNSWGPTWALNGECYLQQNAWNPMYGFPFDAYAIGGVLTDPQDPNDPPILVS